MISVILNLLIALIIGAALKVTDIAGWAWAIIATILCFILGQVALTLLLKHFMGDISRRMEAIVANAQHAMQQKVQRWRTKPISGAKAAEAELAKDRDIMVDKVRALMAPLYKYRHWIPLMEKQLATMELQFAWQKKDMARVDSLLPRALFADPALVCIRMARMWQKEEPIEAIQAVFKKATRRARYGTTTLLYCTMAWMLLKKNQPDEAFKVLNEADEKNEHEVIKRNRDLLANNKLEQFTNSGLGDQWYMLMLETPKIRAQRAKFNNRFFM